MDSLQGIDSDIQRSPALVDTDSLVTAALSAQAGYFLPLLSPTMGNSSAHDGLVNGSEETGSSLAWALVEHPPRYRPHNPHPSPNHPPIYKVPVEILLRVFQLLAPPRARDGVHTLSKLTHVCRFWRIALINQPRAWAAVFVTQCDRRSFVEMCLERSQPVPLEVTIHVSDEGRSHQCCTCDEDKRGRLIPKETNPCEWHFVFESLTKTKHSKRVRTLNILFYDSDPPLGEERRLTLGGCRFFNLPFPQLTNLEWTNRDTLYANHLFSITPFPPTLRSLSFNGLLHDHFTQVNNLTSFICTDYYFEKISAETFRTFVLNNRSLETLSLEWIALEGASNGPPVELSSLKLLSVGFTPKVFSTLIRVPAFRRLSSLRVSITNDDAPWFTFCATGDGIALSVKSDLPRIGEAWQDLTGYARPAIRHIRLYNNPEVDLYGGDGGTVISLLMDAHTLEIGSTYASFWYDDFLGDLKQLGPQLKTIRFEVTEETEPFKESGDEYEDWGGYLLDDIEDLVRYRSEQGRPFSLVERMVVSENEWVNRQQDFVWRCFYSDRRLDRYIRPE